MQHPRRHLPDEETHPGTLPQRRSRVGVVLVILFCLLLALVTIAILRPVLLDPGQQSSPTGQVDELP